MVTRADVTAGARDAATRAAGEAMDMACTAQRLGRSAARRGDRKEVAFYADAVVYWLLQAAEERLRAEQWDVLVAAGADD